MKKLASFFILALALNCFGVGAFNWSDPAWTAWRLIPGAGFQNPTNLPGIVADWDASTVANYLAPVNTFTDLVGGVVATNPSATFQTTNFAAGLWFGGGYVVNYLTNAPITVPTNFTLEVIFRLCQTNNFLAKTNGSQTFIPASVIDGKPRMLVGNGSLGMGISNGVVFGNWGSGYKFSTANYGTTNSFRPNLDIVDVNGTLYTNGVACGTGIGVPTSAFSFTGFGNASANTNISGYLSAVRLWNQPLSAANVAAIYNWNLTNGATVVTNGLITEWKLNDAPGTNITDSFGTNNGYFSLGTGMPTYGGNFSTNPIWTNGFSFVNNGSNNGALLINSNYIVSTSSSNLLNGWSQCTVTYWIKLPSNTFQLTPSDTGSGLGNVIFSKYNLTSQETAYTPGIVIFVEEYNGIIDNSIILAQDDANNNETSWVLPNDGTWHFVVNEISNSIPQQYVDGILRTQNGNGNSISLNGTVISWANSSPWSIGMDYQSWSYICSSNWLDDVCFYTNLLTQKQIAQKLQLGPQ